MRRISFVAAVLLATSAATSFSAKIQLKTIRTQDLRLIYYTQDHEYVTPHVAGCFENSMGFHRELFGYVPSEEVTVLLQDFDDIGYAGATGVPYNWMSIGIEPFEYVYEVSPKKHKLLNEVQFKDEFVVATPVLVRDRILLRGENNLYCIGRK